MKTKQLIKRLRAAGVVITTRKGSGHLKAEYNGKTVSIPFHGGRDLAPSFIKTICKELDLDPAKVL